MEVLILLPLIAHYLPIAMNYSFRTAVQMRAVHRRHGLKLVTTSLACESSLRANRRSAKEIFMEADAMAGDPTLLQAWKQPDSNARTAATGMMSGTTASVSAADAGPAQKQPPQATVIPGSTEHASQEGHSEEDALGDGSVAGALMPMSQQPLASPADVVAGSLAAAAAAASAAAANVYSAAAASAASAAAPLANNIQSFTLSVTSTLPPVRSMASQLQSAAAAGHSTAVATIAAVSAALDSAWGKDR